MSDLQPGTTQAMIDNWVEAGYEPEPSCHKCGHEAEYHDEYGCYAVEPLSDIKDPDGIMCECGGFE